MIIGICPDSADPTTALAAIEHVAWRHEGVSSRPGGAAATLPA